MNYEVAVFTPSYSNDLEYARDLCSSMDRHLKADFQHIVAVPARDLPLFQSLSASHRKIVVKEHLMRTYGLWRLPIPTKISLPGFRTRKLTERWIASNAGLVNGWTVQQILKLSAPELTDAEALLIVDSDVVMFRDLKPQALWRDGAFPLHQNKEGIAAPSLRFWSQAAREMLGLAPKHEDEPFNYIGQLVPWLRSNILELQAHLKRVNGKEWWQVLAAKKDFSEYILYAVFFKEVLAAESGHLCTDTGLYNSIWTDERGVSADLLVQSLLPSHVALHIQSTIPLADTDRRRIIDEVILRADGAAEAVETASPERVAERPAI